MIRVNLLPVKRRKKPTIVPPFIVLMVFILLFSGIGMGVVTYRLNAKITNYTKQKNQNQKRIQELDEKIREVQNYEANNKEFEEKRQIIEKLQRSQNAPVRLMKELAARLTDGVWLESVKEDNWNISLSGMGFTNADIVTFVDSLKGSKYFVDVVLLNTVRKKVGEVPVYSFTIKTRLQI